MKEKLQHIWCVLKQTFQEFGKDNASTMAAAQAYFTVFALPPLLLLAMLLGLFLDDATIQKQVLNQVTMFGGASAADTIKGIFANAQTLEDKGWIAGLISFGVLIFSATNIFIQLQASLDVIWGVEVKPDAGIRRTIMSRVLGFCLILGMGALVVVSMLADVVLSLGQNFVAERLGLTSWVVLFKAISFGVSFGLLTLVFAVAFWFLPDIKVKFRDVIAGALFTSGLFTVSRFALSLYLSHSDVGSAYGAAGSLMVLLFFVFVSMQLFFLGAEFTEIYARSRGDVVKPDSMAQWLPGRPRDSERVLPAEPMTETARREQVGLTSSRR